MKNITAALLSFGMSGRVFHAPFLDVHPGFTLAGSWERSKKDIQNHYPGVKSYDSMESVLGDDSVELVVVNTPTYTHYEYAKRSLEAGKHTVVEKAFTDTVAEAEALRDLAEKNNLVLSVYQNRRWDSDFSTVKDIIDQGVLGDLVEVTFCFDRYSPELSPKLHKEKKGPGAGIVYDLGPHLIDQALYLFGMPKSVFASLAITRETSEVHDYFEFILYYPKLQVRLHSGYFLREPVPSFVLHGKKGSFLKTRSDIQEAELQKGVRPGTEHYGIEPGSEYGLLHTELEDGRIVREKIKTLPGDYMQYYEGVYQAIANGAEVPVSAEDGIHVMQIIEAGLQSNEEKKVVAIR